MLDSTIYKISSSQKAFVQSEERWGDKGEGKWYEQSRSLFEKSKNKQSFE